MTEAFFLLGGGAGDGDGVDWFCFVAEDSHVSKGAWCTRANSFLGVGDR